MEKLEKTITTVEIAEMMGMRHADVLRKLEGQNVRGKHVKGILEILNERNLAFVENFAKSTYRDAKGEERPCYKLTRQGCEFFAHKFQGEKGIIFTARYIECFHQMEQMIIQTQQTEPSEEVKTVRLLPEFSGQHMPEKRYAARFIQNYIAEKHDDVGMYNAYMMWCIDVGKCFLPKTIFRGVKEKVFQLKITTGSWQPRIEGRIAIGQK